MARLTRNVLLPAGYRLLVTGERIKGGDLCLAASWNHDWQWRDLPDNSPIVGRRFDPPFHDAVARFEP